MHRLLVGQFGYFSLIGVVAAKIGFKYGKTTSI
jgi:hypothetical protein